MACYSYVSTRACYDPVRTILVFAPEADAKDLESVQRFAERSGWIELAESDGAVLLLPVAENGWQKEPDTLPGTIFDRLHNRFASRCGKSLTGRNGMLWCWETMVYWVGYQEGAVFAGHCAVAAPNRFAAAALIGGAAAEYSGGNRPSDHWLVKKVSPEYRLRSDQIPACVWILGASERENAAAVTYYAAVNGFDPTVPERCMAGEISALRYGAGDEAGPQLMVSTGNFEPGIALSRTILEQWFHRVIRWKNGPDGTLARICNRRDFYENGRFEFTSVTVNGLEYPCAVHLPAGMTKEQAGGLPLVFSVHGRGEPAWLFAQKNGWDTLADETRAFVLAVPDSPGNIWQLERDEEAFGALLGQLCAQYSLDRSRVYMTGFSNGGAFAREFCTRHPGWFAACAPFNAPVHVPELTMDWVIAPELQQSGWELPYWVTVGDNDPAAGIHVDEQLKIMLAVNGCPLRPAEGLPTGYTPDETRTARNWYTQQRGYQQGGRFTTRIYYGRDGTPRVGYTVMRDMPHGTIGEESRACWEFLRHFSRPEGQKQVVWKTEGQDGHGI